jgi:hypothetical protein
MMLAQATKCYRSNYSQFIHSSFLSHFVVNNFYNTKKSLKHMTKKSIFLLLQKIQFIKIIMKKTNIKSIFGYIAAVDSE